MLIHKNEVSFDTLVDRRLVHRRSLGEVFVTCVLRLDERRWRCGVQFPRSHIRVVRSAGHMPRILMLEASRQAGIAISHLGYKVDLQHQYLLDAVGMKWTTEMPNISPLDPFEAEVDVHIVEVTRRNGRVSTIRFEGSWEVKGNTVATGRALMRCIAPATYQLLRRRAAVAGGERDASATHAEPEDGVVVHWDQDDPMLLDHQLDHVPGMALVDAILGTVPEPTSLEIEFHRFAELDAPVHLYETRAGSERRFEFSQRGDPIAMGRTTEEAVT